MKSRRSDLLERGTHVDEATTTDNASIRKNEELFTVCLDARLIQWDETMRNDCLDLVKSILMSRRPILRSFACQVCQDSSFESKIRKMLSAEVGNAHETQDVF